MSNIVVAIDFSDCSINALLHALSIAQRCKHDLILLWVNKSAAEKEKFAGPIEVQDSEVQKAFLDLIEKYQPELPGNKISFKIRRGKIYREATAEAKARKALLLVAGTHGASGFEKFWAGSNANKIVAYSSCPVLTIRGGIDIKRPLSRILLPIDSTLETRQKAGMAGYLAKCHGAEVIILKLYTSKIKDVRQNVDLYASQVARHMEKEGVPYTMDFLEPDNISDATIQYAKAMDVNLIAIMTEQETTAANLFMGSYAHQTVNRSPIPVLSIHPKDTLATGQGF